MADLKVNVFGQEFKNPIVMASGVFGYGREYEELFPLSALGGMCTKGTTTVKRKGNPGTRITECASGLLFSVGLQNPGIDYYIENELPNLLTKDTVIFSNIAGDKVDEYCEMIDKLEETDAPIIELNISCPNVTGAPLSTTPETAEYVVARARKHTKKPIVAKLSPNVKSIKEIAKAVEAGGADGITLINSIHGMKIDLRTRRPVFSKNIAAMSGACLFPIAVQMVYEASHATNLPVCALGGVTSGEDAAEMMIAGASIVQVGSAIFRDPLAPIHIIEELDEWCDNNGVKAARDLIGTVKPW